MRETDPQLGPNINSSYMQAIHHFLEATNERICGALVQETGEPLWYCYCMYYNCCSDYEIVMSQIPDLHNMEWHSVLTSIMSFAYSTIGIALGFAKVIGFGFYEPYWLVDFTNACIVVHLVGGYQVYSQAVFSFVEGWLIDRCPNSSFVNDFYSVKLPFLPSFRLNLLRICFRMVYVALTIGILMLFSYFNQILGVLRALNFGLCPYITEWKCTLSGKK